MKDNPHILRDPFPRELNSELYKSRIDWDEEERILAEEKKRNHRERVESFFKGKKQAIKSFK